MNYSNLANMRGCKFLKNDNKTTDLFRIVRFQNGNLAHMMNLTTKQIIKCTKEDIIKDYILIRPSGNAIFSIVNVEEKKNSKDVIVALFRNSDIDKDVPYCVCRQNINNIFDIIKPSNVSNISMVGCCVSQETIPEGLTFRNLLSCESIIKSIPISIYWNDTLDDILGCLRHTIKEFDSTLLGIHQAYDRFSRENNIGIRYYGYSDTLLDLLSSNDFMYDFYRAFNILKIEETITVTSDLRIDNSNGVKDNIQKQFEHTIINEIVTEYSDDIDLSKIKGDKAIVVDASNQFYLIAYTKGPSLGALSADDDVINMVNNAYKSKEV